MIYLDNLHDILVLYTREITPVLVWGNFWLGEFEAWEDERLLQT